jgi:hypothetical protein
MRSIHVFAALFVIVGCTALAGIALAGKPSKPVGHTHIVKTHQAVQASRAGERVKSADETTPEGQAEQSSESESNSESADTETGQPGEPAAGQGHEDSAGADVNHECTGNCQE